MKLLHQLSIALLSLFSLTTLTNCTNNPTHFTGDVSINCGSTGTLAAQNGRKWVGDVIKPKHSSLLQIQGSSTPSTLKNKLVSADPIPHKTARVSRSQFSYAFHLSPGQKIIRLHFNPSPYRGFKSSRDLFTVEAGDFTLLGNFSASLTADALRVNSISREFYLNIQENQQLNITFSPEIGLLVDTYAFINGIEIISVPASLSYSQGGDVDDHHTAFELVHRLNIKQHSFVQSSGDFDDAFRTWALRKSDKARKETWKIAVDVGFKYMIRLHFSEMVLKVAAVTGEVVFEVLINEIPTQTSINLVKERDDENKVPRYRDYMVMMRGKKKEGKRDLLISLHSYDDLIDGKGLIAGFEIFKLSNPDNSLASPNPLPRAHGSPSKTIVILFSVFRHRNAFSFAVIAMISLVNIVIHKLREHSEANSAKEENKPSARAERLCRRFSLIEIQLATRNFSDGHLVGRGGFGKVYKGLVDRGQTTVAVKRLKANSMQGKHEFLMEIETLSELRHVNLVSLIGYCNEHREMILVYDYMAGGTLSDHLYKLSRASNSSTSLTWKQRLSICIGAARGLDYLHTGHGVIHRDVKTSNILLDENFIAKVSDFGLAKHEDRSKSLQTHISTRVKGTKGYLDPHYLHTGKLTRKTDTYAFGVVLLEILCGRPVVDSSVAEDEHILTIWARDKINEGEVNQIVASSLREEISPASLKTFVGVAERCLRDDPKNRPTISQVLQQLEIALEQHDNKQVLSVANETSASDDIPANISDGRDLASTGQSPVASIRELYLTSPHEKQTNRRAVNDMLPSVRRATARKPLRFWSLDAFWKRVKPSMKKIRYQVRPQLNWLHGVNKIPVKFLQKWLHRVGKRQRITGGGRRLEDQMGEPNSSMWKNVKSYHQVPTIEGPRTPKKSGSSVHITKPSKAMDKVRIPVSNSKNHVENNSAYRQKTKDLASKNNNLKVLTWHIPQRKEVESCKEVENCTQSGSRMLSLGYQQNLFRIGQSQPTATSSDSRRVKKHHDKKVVEKGLPERFFYSEDSPSPSFVKKISTTFQDESVSPDEAEWHFDNLNHLTDCKRSNHARKYNQKLENLKISVQELTFLTKPDSRAVDQNVVLSHNPDRRYINQILHRSELLNDPSFISTTDQHLSSGHLINPDMFHVLEQTEQITRKSDIQLKKKSQRKIIFDIVDEILVGKVTSGMIQECSLEDLLTADVMYQDYKVCCNGEVPGFVLDIESLIFKELIIEVITTGEVTGPNDGPLRRFMELLESGPG